MINGSKRNSLGEPIELAKRTELKAQELQHLVQLTSLSISDLMNAIEKAHHLIEKFDAEIKHKDRPFSDELDARIEEWYAIYDKIRSLDYEDV